MNLAEVLDGAPDDAVALVSQDRPTSFGELRADVASFAGALVGCGVEPGDRVAVVARTTVTSSSPSSPRCTPVAWRFP